MIISLASIRLAGRGGGDCPPINLQEKTVDVLLTDTTTTIRADSGYTGLSKIVVTHAPVQETVVTTIDTNGSHTITPDEGYDAMMGVRVDVNVTGSIKPDLYAGVDGSVDSAGLMTLGWDEASINHLQNNILWTSGLDDFYKVDLDRDNKEPDANTFWCKWSDTSAVTDMSSMFEGCSSLLSIPLLDTRNVTDMGNMFYGCESLLSIPALDTSSVTWMSSMFEGCSSLLSIPLLDTRNVTDMSSMFYDCVGLLSMSLLDTRNVTDMSNMFFDCNNLLSMPLLDTSSVTTMSSMFYGCEKLLSIPLLDTSSVTIMNGMFENCYGLLTIPALDTSNVTFMRGTFENCSRLLTIPALDTSNVTDMTGMFVDCWELTTIEGIDFSSVALGDLIFSGNEKLTTMVVNGSINVSMPSFGALVAIDYDSVKSILAAANRTTNTANKTLTFNRTMADPDGELSALVGECVNKGWTITGLTLTN